MLAAVAVLATAAAASNVTVPRAEITIGGIKCGVYYPTGPGPFPVVSFWHGATDASGGDYEELIKDIVAEGFVVVANHQDAFIPGGAKQAPVYANKVISNLATAGLKKSADVNTIGVAGHSMGGGIAAMYSGSHWPGTMGGRVKGAVAMHPSTLGDNTVDGGLATSTIPAVFFSGSTDSVVSASSVSKLFDLYGSDHKTQKVLAEVTGIGHFDPCDGGNDKGERKAAAVALSCVVKGDPAACDKVCNGLDKLAPLTKYEKPNGCPAPGPPPAPRYHCDSKTGQCSEAAEGHSTAAKCRAACAAPAPPPPPPPPPASSVYACVVDGGVRACRAESAGFPAAFPTLAECRAKCQPPLRARPL